MGEGGLKETERGHLIIYQIKIFIHRICDDTIDTSFRPDAPPSKREWNLLIYRQWCERLGIDEGYRMTARRLCELIRDRAGDITDIYREIPADRTAERALNLRKGVKKYLLC